jgi:hypothetical protein
MIYAPTAVIIITDKTIASNNLFFLFDLRVYTLRLRLYGSIGTQLAALYLNFFQ